MDESKVRRAMRHVLQQGESLIYVQRQLGRASINLTADTYGKWLPLGNKAAVNRLDATIFSESGSKVVAGSALESEENSEVVGKFGGPCRGRTYGPLIKSEAEGVAQVVDSLGNPLVIAMQYAVDQYSQFVSTCRSSTGFVALPNTVLTPEGGYRPNG